MKYSKRQFLEEVKTEVESLKKFATEEELENLDFGHLEPTDDSLCIYGLMTGSCHTNRAIELIEKCCRKYVDYRGNIRVRNFTDIKPIDKGVPTVFRQQFELQFLSSLEAYIMLPRAKNRNVIQYLKGETDTLTL